jgi:hypothetical protein
MIKKTIIIAVGAFVLYNLFLLAFNKSWSPAQYLYQENIIKGDKYLYGNATPKAVILGTSLAARIITDSLPGFYNVCMPGMGAFDGADVLLKRKELPPFVLIEINYFYKPEREEFKKLFDNKTFIYLKSKIPALKDENQPLAISFDIIHAIKHKKGTKAVQPETRPEPVLFNELLNNQIKTYSHPDEKLVNSSISILAKYLEELQKRGCKVFFFEMPTNPKLTSLPLANLVRRSTLKNFPQYTFIPLPKIKFLSVDGVHLNETEALAYTLYLKTKLKEFFN